MNTNTGIADAEFKEIVEKIETGQALLAQSRTDLGAASRIGNLAEVTRLRAQINQLNDVLAQLIKRRTMIERGFIEVEIAEHDARLRDAAVRLDELIKEKDGLPGRLTASISDQMTHQQKAVNQCWDWQKRSREALRLAKVNSPTNSLDEYLAEAGEVGEKVERVELLMRNNRHQFTVASLREGADAEIKQLNQRHAELAADVKLLKERQTYLADLAADHPISRAEAELREASLALQNAERDFETRRRTLLSELPQRMADVQAKLEAVVQEKAQHRVALQLAQGKAAAR